MRSSLPILLPSARPHAELTKGMSCGTDVGVIWQYRYPLDIEIERQDESRTDVYQHTSTRSTRFGVALCSIMSF